VFTIGAPLVQLIPVNLHCGILAVSAEDISRHSQGCAPRASQPRNKNSLARIRTPCGRVAAVARH